MEISHGAQGRSSGAKPIELDAKALNELTEPTTETTPRARAPKPEALPVAPPKALDAGGAPRTAARATDRGGAARADRASAAERPAEPLDPGTARASIIAGARASRAQISETSGVPLDGSGRYVGLIDVDHDHGGKVKSVLDDRGTGIVPGATTSLTILPVRAVASDTSVSDIKAWSGSADPDAVSRELKSALAATEAETATPRDRATLVLAQMAAAMRATKAGRSGDPWELRVFGPNTPEPVRKAAAEMLNNPGTSPVARAAREAADDWAASAPGDLLKSLPRTWAAHLDTYADALLETKNPDPSKAAFVSTSADIAREDTANTFAQVSSLSPAWRAKHGLGPVSGSPPPEQTRREQALVNARADELIRASSSLNEAPEVVKARQRIESIVQNKLANENLGVIVAAGNDPRSKSLFDTPSSLSVGTTTDVGEPFDPSDRTIAGFSSAGDLAGPGLVVSGSPPANKARVDVGSSVAAPYVAGVAVLISQAAPQLSARQVLDVLKSTAAPAKAPHAERAGAGVIDVLAAVKKARERS